MFNFTSLLCSEIFYNLIYFYVDRQLRKCLKKKTWKQIPCIKRNNTTLSICPSPSIILEFDIEE